MVKAAEKPLTEDSGSNLATHDQIALSLPQMTDGK